MKRIGAPPPHLDRVLARALAPMIKAIRATLPKVDTPAKASALRVAVRKRWNDKVLASIVRPVVVSAEAAASRPWRKIDRALAQRKGKRDAAEYDGGELVERWVANAVKKISSVRDEALDRMHADIVAAHEAGEDAATLAAKWRREGIPLKWGTLEGRTQVIAQNQLSSLASKVQRERARSIGASEFDWRTQGDAKVRDTHQLLEGRRCSYDDPPSEGLPGEPINCRCWAETVIPDELLAELGLDDVL